MRAKCSIVRCLIILLIAAAHTGTPGGSLLADVPPSDSRITESILREFRRDDRLREADIEVTTNSGQVTLKGRVANYFDRSRAQRLCRRVDGVRGISNQLQIGSPPRSDAQIAHAVVQRWKQDSRLLGEDLEAVVDGRILTIEGAVGTFRQGLLAERLAREVRGVLFVRNNVRTHGIVPGQRQTALPTSVSRFKASAVSRTIRP